MKVFITGATGHIGAALAKKLAEDGHTVHALVRSVEKLKDIAHPNIIPFKGELSDPESMRSAMEGCQQVYHLAALAKVWARDTSVFYDINVVATQELLRIAKELKISRVVYTSTAGVYGPSIRRVVNETMARDVDFFNEYEGSKALSESKVKDAIIIDKMDIVIVSPTRVYGPFRIGQTNSVTMMIERFYKGKWRFILGDGTKIGNYIYIDDVVAGHIAAMEKGRTGETYILGGPNHTYLSFFELLRKSTGVSKRLYKLPIWVMFVFSYIAVFFAKYFKLEPLVAPKWIAKVKYHWEVSPIKMEKELGVKGRSLEEGLRLTVEWLKSKKTGLS